MKRRDETSVSARLRGELEAVVGPVRRLDPLAGGCISRALRVETADDRLFVKYEVGAPPGFFEVEADSLRALAAAARLVRVPRTIAISRSDDVAWIALEWLESGPPTSTFSQRLGRGLAEIHRSMGPAWGWDTDGFIGRLPQLNGGRDQTWAEFWRHQRLEPQLRLARSRQLARFDEQWQALFRALPSLLEPAEDEGPSLLHGDLWNGNVMSVGEGPALIDPTCYYGHREVDLAMAALFGGFDTDFWRAYEGAWPLRPGYEVRRRVYQLYYLLVHLNIFGDAYLAPTERTLRQILSGA